MPEHGRDRGDTSSLDIYSTTSIVTPSNRILSGAERDELLLSAHNHHPDLRSINPALHPLKPLEPCIQ